MKPAQESRRFFPTLRWAWPAGGLDQLLLAAACPDESRARAALDAWLNANDIDAVEYRDQRLLVAITDRFGTTLGARPEGPRLAGLQRHLWTRSRMAIAQAATALRRMVDAGIPVMLLKGAARNRRRTRLCSGADGSRRRRTGAAGAVCGCHGHAVRRGLDSLERRVAALSAPNGDGHPGDEFLPRPVSATSICTSGPTATQRLMTHCSGVLWDNAQPSQFSGIRVLVPSEDRPHCAGDSQQWAGCSRP